MLTSKRKIKTSYIKDNATIHSNKLKYIVTTRGRQYTTDSELDNLYSVKSVLMYDCKHDTWIKLNVIHGGY